MSDGWTAGYWRQQGYMDGKRGMPAKLPDRVPKAYEADWWTGFRRGREAREASGQPAA